MADDVSELLQAQYRFDTDAVARLLQAHAGPDVHEAAAIGLTDRLHELLDGDASLVHAWSPDGAQPLHFACFFGHADAVRVLLDGGADPNEHARGFNGVAPINAAAANDPKPNDVCTRIVRLLLERGADPRAAQGGGFTALDAARLSGNDELVALLTEAARAS